MGFFAYLITDGHYGTDTPEAFAERLSAIMEKHRPQYALYRDKSNPDYRRYAEVFLSVGDRYDFVNCLLHGDIELAVQLGAYGVHLTSSQIDQTKDAKEAGLFTVASAHTLEEVLTVQEAGGDAVTFSPIFHSPGKGMPKGVEELMRLSDEAEIAVIALGGIVSEAQINAVKHARASGFASIRYFIEMDRSFRH